MALEDDLDPLYACPLGEFLDRRKALAQALRKAGRKDDAARVAAAAKPTPAAWAVNQLARTNAEEMTALLAAGERLRAVVRATFSGHADASATSEARSSQRDLVTRLARLASQLLEAAGAPASPVTLERIAATLTTISTTGAWGGAAPAQLARELDPPSLETLATLVDDLASARAPLAASPAHDTQSAKAPASPPQAPPGDDTARGRKRSQDQEAARRAAEEAKARIERAEAALREATANEERRRAASEHARAAAALATSQREKREAAAREARRVAAEHEQAAEDARRKAESATASARAAEAEAAGAARDEQAAKAALADAEKALARAAAESIAAEETVIRERRGAGRPPA